MDVLARIKQLLDERNWSIYKLSKASGVAQSTLSNMFSKSRCVFTHLFFHILFHCFITFTGGAFMKNPIFILTEQRQSNDKSTTGAIIQQAITTWLTKELSK